MTHESLPAYPVVSYWLVAIIPELSPLLEAHISENDELLPHIFIADVQRHVMELFRSGDPAKLDTAKIAFSCIEQMIESGDQKVKELAAVSFIELLEVNGDEKAVLSNLLGRHSLEYLNTIHGDC